MPGRRALLQRPVRPMSVIVIDVLAENEPEMPFARDQRPVQAFAARAGDPASRDSVRAGARTGVLMIRIPAAVNTASNAVVKLGVQVPGSGTSACRRDPQGHQQVTGLPGHPLPRRMFGSERASVLRAHGYWL